MAPPQTHPGHGNAGQNGPGPGALRQTGDNGNHQIPRLALADPQPHRLNLHPAEREHVAHDGIHHQEGHPDLLRLRQQDRHEHGVEIGHYAAEDRPAIPQEQRRAWLKELLTGTSESLPYRVAGTLLLLYAQPLVRVAALRTDAINVNDTTDTITISFGTHPVPVPQPFAELLSQHLRNRPTSEQDPALKARGSCPESGQASTSTRTRSCFETPAHLASWAGVCPGANESAARIKSAHILPGNKYLKAALGIAAMSAARSKGTYLAAKYHRLAARCGPMKAIVAIEHSILTAAWHMLANGECYIDAGADHYTRLNPITAKNSAIKKLNTLGYNVTITPKTAA